MRYFSATTLSILVAVFILATCGSAKAQYTGQTIDGTLAFGPDGANGGQFWAPASETVPGTFMYEDVVNTDTAAFTDNTLTVTDVVVPGGIANGWQMTFSDTALPFTELVLVSDNFSPDITYKLSGGVITLDWIGGPTGTNTAVFDIGTPSTVPEPGSLALLGTGALAFGSLLRRKLA